MHTGVLNRREVNIVFLFAVGKLYVGRFELTLRAPSDLFLAEWDTTLLTNLLIEFDHVSFAIIAVTLTVTMFIDEDLPPQRVFCDIDTFRRFEQSLPGELLLSSLLSSLDNSRSFFLNTFYQAFQACHKVLPVILGDGSTNLVPTRVIRQLQVHILEVVRLVLLIELLS